MTPVDASTRGRRNRANGASAERDVARWLRPWWPDACRAVRNTHPDPGDLACTSPGLFWSVKNCQEERIPAWMDEIREKQESRLGLLVVRRRGHASPGRWWAWLTLFDLGFFMADNPGPSYREDIPVRMELGHLMQLLVQANYAPAPKSEVA